ncbi:IQ motif-containing protein H isoform X2 [Xiphophorus couchianus]|uniref:IQ motif-containing protein H isoform X2 n=1 Tax=Xiphophorus couchianus TaxID=32473 RepID=UPI0010164499|nr:IQ domain-containing protein H isoform X2 [Xiphophorus couchianus]
MADIPKHEDAFEDVLVQVQHNLSQLKYNIGKINVGEKGATLDIKVLDNAISRTQHSIRRHADDYLKSVNKQQLVLPAIEDLQKQTLKLYKWKPSLESLPDVYSQRKTFDVVFHERKVKPEAVESLAVAKAKGKRVQYLPEDELQPVIKPNLLRMSAQHNVMSLQPRLELHFSKKELDFKPDKESKCQMDSETRLGRKVGESEHLVTSSPSLPTQITVSDIMDQMEIQDTTSFVTKETEDQSADVHTSTFTIVKGQIDPMTKDFICFKEKFSWCWSSVVDVLEDLTKLLREFAVPLAKVDGEHLIQICPSSDYGWRKTLSKANLFSLLENKGDVLELVSRPGQRYRGEGGRDVAATRIQACWRRYFNRTSYLCYHRRKKAAEVISLSWLLHYQRCQVKKALQEKRFRQLENYRNRAEHLAANWKHIRSSKRTIIHIPSLGFSQSWRQNTRKYDILQNIQITRLCDIRDENVEVIYICPMHLGEDILQYYDNFLRRNGADSSTSQDLPCNKRFLILTPEAVDHFPTRNMCLSTLLKYSPCTLKQIKRQIRGKQAYIVGGVGHEDDLEVADELDVPVLGPEPAVSQLHGTKSGGRRIFSEAGLEVPPGQGDVYALNQLHETLAELIAQNIHIQRWLFKINVQRGGRDTAYCDVCHLRCYSWALRRYQHFGPDLWHAVWVQETVMLKYLEEIPEWLIYYTQLAESSRFQSWSEFLKIFLRQGGVVEAYPPSENVTHVTVDMLLEPSGEVTIQSWGDQLHGYCHLDIVGSIIPKTSVHLETLHSICMRVAYVCQQNCIMGYVSVGLATFVDHSTMKQKIWGIDLDIGFSDQLAMTQMVLMATGGTLDWHTGCFEVSMPVKEKCSEQEALAKHLVDSRYAVIGIHMFHSNLSMLYHSMFFKMCKFNCIEFNKKENQGTVFALYDSSERCTIGMIAVSEDLQGALVTFAQNLSVIHQEILSSKKEEETNFEVVITNIENMLEMIIQNKNQLMD